MLITSNSSPASGELLEDAAVDADQMELCSHFVPESSHTIEIQYISHVPEFHIYDSDIPVKDEMVIDGRSSMEKHNRSSSYDYSEGIPSNDELLSELNDAGFEDADEPCNECSTDSYSMVDNSETDLTNLNWLQNITNIMPVPSLSVSPKPPPKPQVKNMRLHKLKKNMVKCQEDFTQHCNEYKSDSEKKPPYSYCSLIILAMRHNGNKMTLSAIYNWIRENFKYYKNADPTWQNSIRHNLSLNKVFVKVARLKHEPGKGGFWKLDLSRLEDTRRCRRVSSSPKMPRKQKEKKIEVIEETNVVQTSNDFDDMFDESKRATDSISDLSAQLPDFSLDSLELVLSDPMENDFGPNVIVESVAAEEELGELLLSAPWEDLQPGLSDSIFDSYLK